MVELNALLYSQFITYDRLVEIVNETCAHSNAAMAHLYIDMNSLLKSVVRGLPNLRIENINNLTACMANMAIHYRHFFKSRYQTNSKIFFVLSSENTENNSKWYPGYKTEIRSITNRMVKNYTDLLNDLLNYTNELMGIMCPYMDGVYYINTTQEPGVVFQYLINLGSNEPEDHVNFIITKDPYNYQLVNNKDTIILRPKKEKEQPTPQDISYYVNMANIWRVLLKEKNLDINYQCFLSPQLVSLVLAISGLSNRGIRATIPFKKTIEIIQSLVVKRLMINSYSGYADPAIAMIYSNSSKGSKIDKNIINTVPEVMLMSGAFKAIDILYQYELMKNFPEFGSIASRIVDLYDPKGLLEINEKYFTNNPIDFMRL